MHNPVHDAMTWTRADFGSLDAVTFALDDAMRGELAAGAVPQGAPVPAMPKLDALLARAQHEVQSGRGMALLRGLPTAGMPTAGMPSAGMSNAGLTLAAFTQAVWAVGTRFGFALSQNAQGELITQVIDATSVEPTPRMYRSNLELRLHNDITAMLSLACWQPSMEGGLSYLASAGAIHNEILARAPQLLEPLYRGFHYHRLGEEGEGEAEVTPYRMPVFTLRSGQLSCRYQRAGIAAGHGALWLPLTDTETAALDLFDEVAKAPHNRISLALDKGEMLVINNYAVLHARTGFVEYPEPERQRLLIRLWLDREGFRDVPPELNLFASNGVPPQPGRACTYDFRALYANDPRASGGVPSLNESLEKTA